MSWLFVLTTIALAYILFLVLDYVYRKPLIDDFATKSVFITGTDTGFGRLLALKLDRRGVKVYAGCYTQQGADSLQQEASNRLLTLPIDVSDRKSILQAREYVEKDLGPGKGLWGVVNNAGMGQGSFFHLAGIDDYRRVMEVNFFGPINVCQIFLPLVQRARGRIVNITSVFGRCSGTTEPYTSSKHALEVYTNGLRLWQSPFGVHVATIEPGGFNTDITSQKTVLDDVQRSRENIEPSMYEELGGEDYFKAVNADIRDMHKSLSMLMRMNRISMVPNAIIHALGAKRPHHRYVVGWGARIIILLGIVPPDWLMVLVSSRFIYAHQFRLFRERTLAAADKFHKE